ncbi:hypothetical protein KAR91_31190 [Candidatus Pacearchaeota archaeon]|nr:hypothetical protein [Candidatus Pacearchaeota archaeon]
MGEVKIPFRGKWIKPEDAPTWWLKKVAETWREDTLRNKEICCAADREYSERIK